MHVQQVLQPDVSQSEYREDQDQTQVDSTDHQSAADGGMQIFLANKIDSKQEKQSRPDFGRYPCGAIQGEREPDIVGQKGYNTDGHHHGSQQN